MENREKIILIAVIVVLLIVIAFILGRRYQIRKQIRQLELEIEIKRRVNEAISKSEAAPAPNIKPSSATYDKSSVTNEGTIVYEEKA